MTQTSDAMHDDPVATTMVDHDDLGISAQARALSDLDRMLGQLARRSPNPIGALVDIGCGMGALTARIGNGRARDVLRRAPIPLALRPDAE